MAIRFITDSICTNNKKKRGLNVSVERGYKPSSDLEAKFSTYHETFNVCLQN